MPLGRAILVLALLAVPTFTTYLVNHDFALTGVSGAMAVFRAPLYAQLFALLLLIATACGYAFLKKARRWLAPTIVLAGGCYVLSLHALSSIWPTHQLTDHYSPFFGRTLSIEPSDAGLPGFTCISKGLFIARFVNEKKDGAMSVFLGIYPWRIDDKAFDQYFNCAQQKIKVVRP